MAKPAKIRRLISLALASFLILLSWWGIHSVQSGLTTRTFEVEGTPMQFMAPKQGDRQPGILIAHGFSGSKQLMLGYAHVLAHNGYGVLLWDFPGHGANSQVFDREVLNISFNLALSTLAQQPEINPQKLAAIGHSMGSRVVLQGGIDHAQQLDAVVALSPSRKDDVPVTPELPKNLNLQAGVWEPPFVEKANRLLKQAGGPNSDLTQGKGRAIAIIPSVEHATILFSDISHQETLSWLNQTFNRTSNSPYRDRRMSWYGLHLLGWIVALSAIFPTLKQPSQKLSWRKRPLYAWGGLLGAPVAAILMLKLMSLLIPIDNFGGILIGGTVGIWMFVAGLSWMGVMVVGQSHWVTVFPRPTVSDVKIGGLAFVMLWLGLGALAQWVWLPWFLLPARLLLWFFVALACMPWFLAAGIVQSQVKLGPRWGWWLAQSLVLVLGLIVTTLLMPSLDFLILLLPIFPLLMGLFSFVAPKIASPWAYGFACASIFSWLIVVPFPIT